MGAAIFSHTEKHAKTVNDGAPWSFGNAMYFCYIASTSIGMVALASVFYKPRILTLLQKASAQTTRQQRSMAALRS